MQAAPVKKFPGETKRYVRRLKLRDNPELISEYRLRHSQEKIWPEIIQGIREVGILEMEIFILGTDLVMIMEVPADFDWDKAMARLATLPRQQEWEDYMALFQQSEPGSTADRKWQTMDRMFHLYD